MSRAVTVPQWLNESFLQTVLEQDGCHKEVKVQSIEITPAVAPGANYVCVLFRLRGKYQTEDEPKEVTDISLIVKTLLATNYLGKMGDEYEITKKECIVYREFLPEIYNVLGKEQFTAKLIYSPEPNILVFEDLKNQGFMMVDRLKQLDFEHCLMSLKTVAKFHAAGVAVTKSKPEFIEILGKGGMYSKDTNTEIKKKWVSEVGKSMAKLFTKVVQTWEGFEDFEDKSRHVWETLHDDLCDVFEPRKDSLNVINHGDLWMNNMLFKYDKDGNIVDFRLVDFQMCHYGTPVTDLLYFLYSSANQEVRENRLDELFSAYLETLNSVLEHLGCEERLTRIQLDAELKRCQCFILSVTCGVLGGALSDPDDLLNIDEVTEENMMSTEVNPFEKLYHSKYYEVVAQQVLRYLDKEGFFERQKKEMEGV